MNLSRSRLLRAEKQPTKTAVDEAFERSAKRGPVTWASFVCIALAGGAVVLYVRHAKEKQEQRACHISVDDCTIIHY